MEFLRVPCVFGRTYLWYFSFYIVFFWCLPSSPQLRSCDGISFTVSAWPLGRLEVLLLAVYHTVISLQNLTTNEHVPSLSGSNLCEQIICKNQFFFVCGKIGSWSWHIRHAQTNMSNMSLCLEVKNYYREGQNPFDYGGPGTQILDTLEFPVRKEGESKMECLWRFPRFFLASFWEMVRFKNCKQIYCFPEQLGSKFENRRSESESCQIFWIKFG